MCTPWAAASTPSFLATSPSGKRCRASLLPSTLPQPGRRGTRTASDTMVHACAPSVIVLSPGAEQSQRHVAFVPLPVQGGHCDAAV